MAGKPYAYSDYEVRAMLRARQQGIPYKIMAERFGRHPETIRTHLYRVRKKFGPADEPIEPVKA